MEINLEKIQEKFHEKWDPMKNVDKRFVIGALIVVVGIYLILGIASLILGKFWMTMGVISAILGAVGIAFTCIFIAEKLQNWLNRKYPDEKRVRR